MSDYHRKFPQKIPLNINLSNSIGQLSLINKMYLHTVNCQIRKHKIFMLNESTSNISAYAMVYAWLILLAGSSPSKVSLYNPPKQKLDALLKHTSTNNILTCTEMHTHTDTHTQSHSDTHTPTHSDIMLSLIMYYYYNKSYYQYYVTFIVQVGSHFLSERVAEMALKLF